MSLRSTLDFLLCQWLGAESLNQRERFAGHSHETFDAVFDTCERIAREKYAPFNRTADTQEPRFDGEKVILPQATHDAQQAHAASGMLSAAPRKTTHWAACSCPARSRPQPTHFLPGRRSASAHTC